MGYGSDGRIEYVERQTLEHAYLNRNVESQFNALAKDVR